MHNTLFFTQLLRWRAKKPRINNIAMSLTYEHIQGFVSQYTSHILFSSKVAISSLDIPHQGLTPFKSALELLTTCFQLGDPQITNLSCSVSSGSSLSSLLFGGNSASAVPLVVLSGSFTLGPKIAKLKVIGTSEDFTISFSSFSCTFEPEHQHQLNSLIFKKFDFDAKVTNSKVVEAFHGTIFAGKEHFIYLSSNDNKLKTIQVSASAKNAKDKLNNIAALIKQYGEAGMLPVEYSSDYAQGLLLSLLPETCSTFSVSKNLIITSNGKVFHERLILKFFEQESVQHCIQVFFNTICIKSLELLPQSIKIEAMIKNSIIDNNQQKNSSNNEKIEIFISKLKKQDPVSRLFFRVTCTQVPVSILSNCKPLLQWLPMVDFYKVPYLLATVQKYFIMTAELSQIQNVKINNDQNEQVNNSAMMNIKKFTYNLNSQVHLEYVTHSIAKFMYCPVELTALVSFTIMSGNVSSVSSVRIKQKGYEYNKSVKGTWFGIGNEQESIQFNFYNNNARDNEEEEEVENSLVASVSEKEEEEEEGNNLVKLSSVKDNIFKRGTASAATCLKVASMSSGTLLQILQLLQLAPVQELQEEIATRTMITFPKPQFIFNLIDCEIIGQAHFVESSTSYLYKSVATPSISNLIINNSILPIVTIVFNYRRNEGYLKYYCEEVGEEQVSSSGKNKQEKKILLMNAPRHVTMTLFKHKTLLPRFKSLSNVIIEFFSQ